jgi:hypothetical protein
MTKKKKPGRYLLCVNNDDYPVSLEVRKVYRRKPDRVAASRNYVRVIDESSDDYLYPADLFVPIEVPSAAKEAFAAV